MKVGIIGAGQIVCDVLPHLDKVKGFNVNAICATKASKEKLVNLCSQFSIGEYYLDVDEMLEKADIDTVYVAVPNVLHYIFCKKALEKGKNVICEKPFTTSFNELEELIVLAKEKELILVEAVSTNYLPNTIKIKERLNELGEIKIVSMNYSQYSSRYNAFKNGDIMPAFDPLKAGGALMDLNIYNLNFVVCLFGKPKDVMYYANIEKGIDTSGVLILDYEKFKCVCIAAKDCKAPINSTIQGDKGYVYISSPVNVLSGFGIVHNDQSKQVLSNVNELENYNENHHRMHYVFKEITEMIDNKDLDYCGKMQEISLITMEIQTKARKMAKIVFPND